MFAAVMPIVAGARRNSAPMPHAAEPPLEPEAARSLDALAREAALAAGAGPSRARLLGRSVAIAYRDALLSANQPAAGAAWARFVSAVWTFANELERSGSARSVRARSARRTFKRIALENLDLIA